VTHEFWTYTGSINPACPLLLYRAAWIMKGSLWAVADYSCPSTERNLVGSYPYSQTFGFAERE